MMITLDTMDTGAVFLQEIILLTLTIRMEMSIHLYQEVLLAIVSLTTLALE